MLLVRDETARILDNLTLADRLPVDEPAGVEPEVIPEPAAARD
jgi:hypothetical protein